MAETMSWGEMIAKIRAALVDKRDSIFAVAAEGVDAEYYTECLMQQMASQPKLTKCTLGSLAVALQESAVLGLPIGSVLGYAHAVPYNNRNAHTVEAHFQVGYQGSLKLAYESPRVQGADAQCVYHGDSIKLSLGTQPQIYHSPLVDENGDAARPCIGVYAVVWLAGGAAITRWMTWGQVLRHRDKYSKGHDRDDSAWKTAPEAMACNTVLKRALKYAPLRSEARLVLQREEHHDAEEYRLRSGEAPPSDDLEELAAGAPEADVADDDPLLAGDPCGPCDENGVPVEAAESKEKQEVSAVDDIPF